MLSCIGYIEQGVSLHINLLFNTTQHAQYNVYNAWQSKKALLRGKNHSRDPSMLTLRQLVQIHTARMDIVTGLEVRYKQSPTTDILTDKNPRKLKTSHIQRDERCIYLLHANHGSQSTA